MLVRRIYLQGGADIAHFQRILGHSQITVYDQLVINRGSALTLGNVQIYPTGNLPSDNRFYYGVFQNLGKHEQRHTIQSEVLGFLWLPAYFLSGGRPKAGHPFEDAATDYATGGSALP